MVIFKNTIIFQVSIKLSFIVFLNGLKCHKKKRERKILPASRFRLITQIYICSVQYVRLITVISTVWIPKRNGAAATAGVQTLRRYYSTNVDICIRKKS